MQVDGGMTFTEPSAVISGEVEGRKEVSSLVNYIGIQFHDID